MEETKKCPYCGEEILAVAKKCKHCGEFLDDAESKVDDKLETVGAKQAEVVEDNSVEEEEPQYTGIPKMLNTLGTLLYVFAVADFVFGTFFSIDFTGSRYSPVIIGLLGGGCQALAAKLAKR